MTLKGRVAAHSLARRSSGTSFTLCPLAIGVFGALAFLQLVAFTGGGRGRALGAYIGSRRWW